jgi:hypothetical protein
MRTALVLLGLVLWGTQLITPAQAQYNRAPYRQSGRVGGDYPYRPGNSGEPNVGLEIFKGIVDLGVQAAKDAERNRRYNDDYDYRPRPQYVPPPQQYYYPTPQPAARPAPAPPKNLVAKKPPKNANFQLTGADFNTMSAELDARQGVEVAEAGGKLDAAIENHLENSNLSPQDKAAAQKAWAEAVTSGDSKKFEEFQDKFGSKLSPDGQKMVDTRVELANYRDDLLGGGLTAGQKESRLEKIDKLITSLPPGPLQNGLQDNLGQMQQFNDLSNLVTLTQGNDNALQLIMTGSNNAGLGPGFVAEISGLPIMGTEALSDSKVAITDILLMNDRDSEQSISYTLGQHTYTMGPGEKQALTKSYVVAFHTGVGETTKRYTLTKGVYRFVQTSAGWDLSRDETVTVVIDNTEYMGSFSYLLNGKQFSVGAGESKEHSDTTAIAIEFDRGNGTTTRKVVSTGTYQVGIDPNGTLLDLYEVEAATAESDTIVSARPVRQDNGAKSKAKQIEEALARLKAKKT